MTWREPPPGWYTFGTHANHDPVPPLEFSAEVDEEDLLPLWERPVTNDGSKADEP